MTKRNLFDASAKMNLDELSRAGIEFEPPAKAAQFWHPLAAKRDDGDRVLNISAEIGEYGVGLGYVQGFLRRVGAGDVTVNINSTGGDYFAGLGIYNALREHEGLVTTNVLGLAASAASIIAMASDQLNVAKSGFLMIHNSWALAIGNRHVMSETRTMLSQFDEVMAEIYADRSGIDADEIRSMMDAETFLAGNEAVDRGLADGLLESDDVVEVDETPAEAAVRRLDNELSKAGLTRSERRDLIKEISNDSPGKSGAADEDAGGKSGAAATVKSGADLDLLLNLKLLETETALLRK